MEFVKVKMNHSWLEVRRWEGTGQEEGKASDASQGIPGCGCKAVGGVEEF